MSNRDKKKILITGGFGLVGSAVQRVAESYKDRYSFVFTKHSDGDLRDENYVKYLFSINEPLEAVISLAARVGGLGLNQKYPADLLRDNLLINTNVIHYSHVYKVKKVIACSSICAFPNLETKLKESDLQNGPLFEMNESYGLSKRVTDTLIRSYKKQYGLNGISVIPGNIAGKSDLYNESYSHILPSLVLKLYKAKKENKPLTIWGDGTAKRSFILSDDLAKIMLRLVDEFEELPERLSVVNEEYLTIKEIVSILCDVADFRGEVIYDTTKPNGQKERIIDVSLLKSLFPDSRPTPTRETVEIVWKDFNENYPNVRGFNI
jgi:GDP-L-fucose synthase